MIMPSEQPEWSRESCLTVKFSLQELDFSDEEPQPGSLTTAELPLKKFVCVDYPAMVSNVDRMLASMGGEKTINKTFSDPNRRLEVRFRPQDPFCHAVCGNRYNSCNLVFKVRRRTSKKDPSDVMLKVEILGVIDVTYKFQGMADFQYLAVDSQDGVHTSLYDKMKIDEIKKQDYFEQDRPYFLPPPIFSRLDTPTDYGYRPNMQHRVKDGSTFGRTAVIGGSRPRRPHNAIFVTFTQRSVPTVCVDAALTNWVRCCAREVDKENEIQLKQMFENRPIWSRNAVKGNMNIHNDKLKLLLPVCAYYMVTGPWRSLWVRFGYDPRKCPESKIYQMLDFRIRFSAKHGVFFSDIPVKAKRSTLNYSLSVTLNKTGPPAVSLAELSVPDPSEEFPAAERLKESAYIFREGMLPPHRQMFYQLCDLDVPSIKELVELNNGQEETCDERDGWCVVGTTDKIRDILSVMMKEAVQDQREAKAKNPKKSQDKDINEEDEVNDDDEEVNNDDEEGNNDDEEYEEDFDENELDLFEESENEMVTEILNYL